MASKQSSISTNITKDRIAQVIDEISTAFKNKRKNFERHWYDNNFFDDGHHYRYLQHSTNKIIDLSERATIFTPRRAIPKASRPIRLVAALLVSTLPPP